MPRLKPWTYNPIQTTKHLLCSVKCFVGAHTFLVTNCVQHPVIVAGVSCIKYVAVAVAVASHCSSHSQQGRPDNSTSTPNVLAYPQSSCGWHKQWYKYFTYILSDTSTDTFFWHSFRHSFRHSIWHIFWHSICHSFQAFILGFYLEPILTVYLAFFWHSVWHSLWQSLRDVAPAPGPLHSLLSSQRGTRSWGPAVPTEIWSWQLKTERRNEKKKEEQVTLIKCRDPHLAGGEKCNLGTHIGFGNWRSWYHDIIWKEWPNMLEYFM